MNRMWFFRSVEYLPRPSLRGLIPTVSMLAVWALLCDLDPRILGWAVQPLWLALAVMYVLILANGLPGLWQHATEAKMRGFTAVVLALLVGVIGAGALAGSAWGLQLAWLVATLAYVLLLLSVLLFDRDTIPSLPLRWGGNHPFAEQAAWIGLVRLAVVIAGASWLMTYGTVDDWVLFVTIGRLALFYLFEWITILFAMTWQDEEG